MLLLLSPVMMFFSLLFIQVSHPLSLGLILLFQTCLVCVASGLMSLSFWFSYILFLVFLGGLLVLFIYVASLASNEFFSFRSEVFAMFTVFVVSVLLIAIMDMMGFSLSVNYMNSEMVSTPSDLYFSKTIYSESVMTFTLFIVFYLLLTLFVVVEITGNYFGPLRFST
uniref:NADH-ubiquinone oxidoreductase chain 6 n=1 Tax=Filhollianassa ceramica TaxID=2734693 RepID=A0A1B3TRD8_9EUCA|nr:NADH dehydrogenase subunit 6 [Filhollianassa ceramica]ANW37033.1 NADH dehydrogenase subunit 6 [Filhollianassa ceramica]AOH05875.1 NADH dehydrogenase subunit 6 [Filhollianassa ceramica]